jgi:hypothetical protein
MRLRSHSRLHEDEMKKQRATTKPVESVEIIVANKIKAILDQYKCVIRSKVIIENNQVSTEIVISRVE